MGGGYVVGGARTARGGAAVPPPAPGLCGLRGRLEVPDWPGWVAGALLGDPAWRPGPLDRLVDLHLVEPLGADRV
ncbi:hypothetical protein K7G98_42655, partial [Saccharothrix sp. MB29]|nr:hypothetical protein [Saccharothrix sp. MB29]